MRSVPATRHGMLLGWATGLACLTGTLPVSAQTVEAEPAEGATILLDEIHVTARRSSEPLSEVPMASAS